MLVDTLSTVNCVCIEEDKEARDGIAKNNKERLKVLLVKRGSYTWRASSGCKGRHNRSTIR